jgi:hypothetical protein
MRDCIFPRGNFAQEGFGSAKMEVEKASLNGEGRQKGVGQDGTITGLFAQNRSANHR